MTWYYWTIIIIAILILLKFYLSQPVKYKNKHLSDFPLYIKGLLAQVSQGSVALFKRAKANGFYQIVLSKNQKNSQEIELVIPQIDGFKTFNEILDFVKDLDLKYTLEENQSAPIEKFLRISITGSQEQLVENSYNLILKIHKILEWDKDDIFSIYYMASLGKQAFENSIENLEKVPDSFIKKALIKHQKKIIGKF